MLLASETAIPIACVHFVHLLVLSAVNVCVPDASAAEMYAAGTRGDYVIGACAQLLSRYALAVALSELRS